MALKNGKTLKTTLKIFFKDNGREPDFEEFRKLVTGKADKKVKVPETSETEEKST